MSPVSRSSARARMWMPSPWSSSMVLSPSVRFRARRSIRGTTTTWPGRIVSRSCFHAGQRMFRARGDVGEDAVVTEPVVGQNAALGGQPALSLGLGDPDVAEDCGVHDRLRGGD